MNQHAQEVSDMLDRILAGGDVDFDEVQKLNWSVSDDLAPLLQKIYRELQMFASDEDIRRKDPEYNKSWRRGLSSLREELQSRL